MKKICCFLSLIVLSSIFALSGCDLNFKLNKQEEKQTESETNEPAKQEEVVEQKTEKIKEIALKNGAKTVFKVTEKIITTSLYELKLNKGQTLKAADKKVIVTSSDPEILKVDNTSAAISTFLLALKPGDVKLTIQSNIQEQTKLEIDVTVKDSAFDRQEMCLSDVNIDNCDMSHEADEENPYIKTIAEEGTNHEFIFRNSYSNRFYAESEFTFYSEKDGGAHLPKIGFIFSTKETNDLNATSASLIYFDTDCSGGKTTFYNLNYNEIVNSTWGWDYPGGSPLAKSCNLYKHEVGISVGETFTIGVAKDNFYYHVYFNGIYVKSIETTFEGFSVDNSHTNAAPTICGLFDFKSEVKYSNYSFTIDETTVSNKIPATPVF